MTRQLVYHFDVLYQHTGHKITQKTLNPKLLYYKKHKHAQRSISKGLKCKHKL